MSVPIKTMSTNYSKEYICSVNNEVYVLKVACDVELTNSKFNILKDTIDISFKKRSTHEIAKGLKGINNILNSYEKLFYKDLEKSFNRE